VKVIAVLLGKLLIAVNWKEKKGKKLVLVNLKGVMITNKKNAETLLTSITKYAHKPIIIGATLLKVTLLHCSGSGTVNLSSGTPHNYDFCIKSVILNW